MGQKNKWKSSTLQSVLWALHGLKDISPKIFINHKGKDNDLTGEKSRIHSLKCSRSTSPVIRHINTMTSLIRCTKEDTASPLWYSCPESTPPCGTLKPHGGTFYKTTDQDTSKVSRSSWTRKGWGPVTDWRRLRRHKDKMQHGISEQKKDIRGKAGEICIQSIV